MTKLHLYTFEAKTGESSLYHSHKEGQLLARYFGGITYFKKPFI